MLDTTREFETPEGIELQLHVAGPISRASAWIIDALIRSLIYTIAMFVFALFGQLGWGVYLILIFLVEWFYPVIFEVKRGATPGKKIFKLYVCHDNGTPISWQASVIRNLLRVVDFLPLFYGLGLIAMLMNRDFKRLGDFAAGTLVIYKDQGERSYHVPEKKPLPLPEPLRLVEQRAILEFAERQEQLSEARGVELAQILNELTQQEGTKAKDSLLRYANWIQKRRYIMKQYAFEKEYAELWQEYDVLSKALEERKSAYQVKNTHPPSGNYEFPSLYRRICHHYAIAQQRHYSPQLINQLHQRVLLGHQLLYEHKSSTLWRMFSFLWMTFPQQVRKHWQHFWLATALFYVPAILMGLACYNDSEFIYQSMSSHEVSSMEYMYDPANDKIGRRAERQSDSDFMMFGFYIYNNISIGFRSYAMGILAGIGTIFIMLYNGTVIGGVAGHLTQLGFIETFWPFVSGHGSFELTALCICGAAGLRLGQPLIAPGRHRRIDAFKIAGHESVQLVLGAAFMLLVAAFIEAFWSSSSFVTNEIKYLVGAFLWFVVIVYLGFVGKTEK